jgi:hypothetical protein
VPALFAESPSAVRKDAGEVVFAGLRPIDGFAGRTTGLAETR